MTLNITLKPGRSQKILVEMDADKFERLAASLGLFSDNFVESLEKSERDYKAGRVRKIESLKELTDNL